MLVFEAALARVEDRLGVIPAGTAAAVEAAAAALKPDMARLGRGAAATGHPVAALVEQLRRAAGAAGDYVHWGATAQDAADTALVLQLGRAADMFDARLAELVRTLADQARRWSGTIMAGRTRYQQAVPITFGLKAAGWLAPLARHRRRLAELRPRALRLQFGGAAGTLSVLGPQGLAVEHALAEELGLPAAVLPWHTQRDSLAELANWLALVTSSLAKFGQDLALLAQTELAEATDGSQGGSSTMPHKANPVRSETLVALGRMNAGLLATMHHATVQEHERGGSGWTLEWLTLPQMTVLTGASLRQAQAAATALAIDPQRMRQNAEASQGTLLAEAAAFALATSMPLARARELVQSASRRARESGEAMLDLLAQECGTSVSWEALRNPANYLGAARALVDRAVANALEDPLPMQPGDPAATAGPRARGRTAAHA